MSDEFTGPCKGGPHDGEFRTYASTDMPILATGLDTEGDLLGHYRFKDGSWLWEVDADAPPDDAERTR